MDKNKILEFLEEKPTKIESDELLYPSIEIEQILDSNNKIILLNGKYGSGKTTVINSIPKKFTSNNKVKKCKIANISLLEDNLKYFKFNIYNKINKKCWFEKYSSWIFFILTILSFLSVLYLHLRYNTSLTEILFQISSFLMSSIFAVFLLFLFNLKILKFLNKYEANNQKYFLHDIDHKIIKKMNKKNLIIAIEDIDRLEEKQKTEFISLLNSLITKISKELNNSNSKLILAMDLNKISKDNLSLINKSNYFIINMTIHTNNYLCTWLKKDIKKYLDNKSEEIFWNFPWILTIREIKKIVKDSINDLNFFKESRVLNIFYKEWISFNFFLLKNLLIFSFKREKILNKKINWLFKEDYSSFQDAAKHDILKEYMNLNFNELPISLQELILDNIYLKHIGTISIADGFNYIYFYLSNRLNYIPNKSKLQAFLKFIEEKYKDITSPGIYYISSSLKKELLNLDLDFINSDSIYINLVSNIRNSFNDNETNQFINLIKKISTPESEKNIIGIDFYIKNKFNHYLNLSKSSKFSNQIIYKKIGWKLNKNDYLDYLKQIIDLNKPIYINWKIINEDKDLQNLLLSENFNYDLNKRFWISLTKLIFEIYSVDISDSAKKSFLNLLEKKEFIEFKKEFIEIYNSNYLSTFFNSIVELFYFDKTKFGSDYYSAINQIIIKKRKEIDINKSTYDMHGKINYLFWPWHFITLETPWIIENFNNQLISKQKMKFIYNEIISNIHKLEEKYQQKIKEKMNFINKTLNLNFKKL